MADEGEPLCTVLSPESEVVLIAQQMGLFKLFPSCTNYCFSAKRPRLDEQQRGGCLCPLIHLEHTGIPSPVNSESPAGKCCWLEVVVL